MANVNSIGIKLQDLVRIAGKEDSIKILTRTGKTSDNGRISARVIGQFWGCATNPILHQDKVGSCYHRPDQEEHWNWIRCKQICIAMGRILENELVKVSSVKKLPIKSIPDYEDISRNLFAGKTK